MAVIEQILDEYNVLHYSDRGMKIRQIETGYLFNDAGDLIPCVYSYEETDIPVDVIPEPEEEIDAEDALDILIGECDISDEITE